MFTLNGVAFKILMAELSNYSEKFDVWITRKLLKSKGISPIWWVRNLEVVGITPWIAFPSVDPGRRYGLLPSDPFHLATIREFGINLLQLMIPVSSGWSGLYL